MKKLLTFLFVLSLASAAYATPPKDLKLSYSNGSLTASMKHITNNLRDHFIRTIRVIVNNGEPQVFHYPFQKSPTEFEALIPLTLNPRDHVVVKAECKEGGSATAELTVFANDDAGNTSGASETQDTSVETPYGK